MQMYNSVRFWKCTALLNVQICITKSFVYVFFVVVEITL
jgi:hypothetical protein